MELLIFYTFKFKFVLIINLNFFPVLFKTLFSVFIVLNFLFIIIGFNKIKLNPLKDIMISKHNLYNAKEGGAELFGITSGNKILLI